MSPTAASWSCSRRGRRWRANLGDNDEDTSRTTTRPSATEPFAVSPAAVFHEGAAANASDLAGTGYTIVYMGTASQFGGLVPTNFEYGVVLDDENSVGSVYGISFTSDNFFIQGSELDGAISRGKRPGGAHDR